MHNHPSDGDPTPSQADIQMTKAIVQIATPPRPPTRLCSLGSTNGLCGKFVSRLSMQPPAGTNRSDGHFTF
jgi:hypothetical protein